MTATLPAPAHLDFTTSGEPVLTRTRFKALHLIREHLAYGWGAEELALNHPQLRLGEVYAVLGWYADHAPEVEALLDEEAARAGTAHARPGNRRLSRLLKPTAA